MKKKIANVLRKWADGLELETIAKVYVCIKK